MTFEKMIQHAGNLAIFKKIQMTSHLPTPPAVAIDLVRASNNPDTDFEILAGLLEKDPALAAKIMQLANSALYTRLNPVSSLKQAVSRLGIKATCTVASGLAIAGALRHLQCHGIDLNLMWKRSITAAAFVRRVSTHTAISDHDAVFLGALLQDIGVFVLCAVEPDFYHDLSHGGYQTHPTISVYEQSRLEVDHAAIGAYLLYLWRLPSPIVTTVAGSHDTSSLFVQPGESLYAQIGRAASLAADLWVNPTPHIALIGAAGELVRYTDMDKNQLIKTLEGIEDEVRSMAATFDVAIKDADTFVGRAVHETIAFFQKNDVSGTT